MIKKPKDDKKKARTVFVTGAASGIGKAIALKFAENGWNVLCHYYSSEKDALALKRSIESLGLSCGILKTDLSLKKGILRLLQRLDKFSIDALVNNAGTYISNKHFSDLDFEDFEKTFMINTFAPAIISSRLYLPMKERRFGRIVNISSIAAKYGGSAHSLHYGCSKRAIEGVTKTLAREGAQYNILVNTVRPGVIDTDFHKKFPKNMKKRIGMIPLLKMGTTGDIADMVYYLGSDENKFITNEIITVAGGE